MKKPRPNLLDKLNLLPYQRAFAANTARFKIALWARQTGKDHTATAEAVADCLQNPGAVWLILAACERQSRESLAKAQFWADVLETPVTHSSRTELRWPNGSRLLALPGRPATIRGFSANIILTEFAFHEDQAALWQAVFPTITNPIRGLKKLRVITTPNGQNSFFHQLWKNPNPDFHKQKITIHDAIADGLQLDAPALRRALADPDAWAQEYECRFMDTSTVLLPYDLIQTCTAPEATHTTDLNHLKRQPGEIFLGIDFGRKQHLTVCWLLQRIDNLLWTREILELRDLSTPAQLEALRPRAQLARKICLDSTGAGVGLGDLLQQQFHSKLELCTFTASLKQELFPKLRTAFEQAILRIPDTPEIREDLHGLLRVVSPSGQIAYRASQTPDGHSDRCTALALALRAAQSAPRSFAAVTFSAPSRLR